MLFSVVCAASFDHAVVRSKRSLKELVLVFAFSGITYSPMELFLEYDLAELSTTFVSFTSSPPFFE